MSWTRNVRHPSKIVSIGETIEAVVLKVDETEEKISLGMKQTEQDPWMVLPNKYPVGTRIQGKVRNLTSFGAFVEIEPGIDGLVHISDMSWTKRIQHPSEVVKKGDDVDVVILGVDAENKRISLGLKQTMDDPWEHLATQFHPGQEINGQVTRLQDKGVAVDLGDDVEGFVPVSQLGVTGLQNPADVFIEGDDLEMRVTEVDAGNRRIVLEVTRVPKFEGGEPIFRVREEAPAEGEAPEGDAPEAEAPAAAPEANEAEAPLAEAVEAAPAAEADEAGDEPVAEPEEG
jgi:small subunit ribosomal protein S1